MSKERDLGTIKEYCRNADCHPEQCKVYCLCNRTFHAISEKTIKEMIQLIRK